jgi:hypothetical protein
MPVDRLAGTFPVLFALQLRLADTGTMRPEHG